MSFIPKYSDFLLEKNAIQATQDQLKKAMKKVGKYDNKAAAAKYDVQFKKDKLEYEKKKDAYQNDVKDAKDGVERETEKAALRGLEAKWKETKTKYKDRLKQMR